MKWILDGVRFLICYVIKWLFLCFSGKCPIFGIMHTMQRVLFVGFLFLCVSFPLASQAQKKLVDTYTINTKEQKPVSFILTSQVDANAPIKDTVFVKFTFSLLGDGELEKANDNFFSFRMKYTRTNVVTAINNLPDNIINKLRINSSAFPSTAESFCRERILKIMGQTFKIIDSDLKLKKIGAFE